jgi:hypothetical protein
MALAVFLLAPTLLASQKIPALANPLSLTLAGLLAVGISIVLGRTLPGLLDPETKGESETVIRVAFALVAMGWGPLMAYQAGNIPLLQNLTLSVQDGSLLKAYFPAALPVLIPIQVSLIAAGAIIGAIALPRIRALADKSLDRGLAGKDQANERKGKTSTRGWTTLLLGASTYVLACFALLM